MPSSPAQRAPLDIRFKHAMLLIDGKTPTEILQEQIRENGVIVGPERMLKVLHRYTKKDEFKPEVVAKVSRACCSLCMTAG